MEVTQEKPNLLEDLEEKEVVTQEPTSLQLPIEATTENQEVPFETQEYAEIGTQEYISTKDPTYSPLAVGVDKKGFQKEGFVT